MAYQKSKGCSVEQEISSVYTAIAQISGVDYSGAKSLSEDTTTLDTSVFKTYGLTGFSEPGKVDLELKYDSQLSGHQEFNDLVTTPASRNYKVKDSAGNVMLGPFASASIEPGFSIKVGSFVTAKIGIQITGNPGLAT